MRMDIFSMTHDSFAAALRESHGVGAFHAGAVYREICARGNIDFGTAPAFDTRAPPGAHNPGGPEHARVPD